MAATPTRRNAYAVLLFLCFSVNGLRGGIFLAFVDAGGAEFSFSSFSPGDPADRLVFLGDAAPARGALELTLNSATESLQYSTGRSLFATRVQVGSFSTNFTFSVQNLNASSFGDGLAFGLFPDSSGIPDTSYGGWLGLFNADIDGHAANRLVAVEFDTFCDAWDPDDNHVGVDANGIASVASASLYPASISLKSGLNITAWIDYNHETKLLLVYVAQDSLVKPDGLPPLLSVAIDLSELLLEYMYVGFSAATGLYPETHTLYSWAFTSSGLPDRSQGGEIAWIGAIVLGSIVVLALLGGVAQIAWRRWRSVSDGDYFSAEDWQIPDMNFGPRRFSYRELKKATKGFNPGRLLGEGGFGSVYRGVLPDTKQEVAVKRISKQSKQGMREFVAEVKTISRLRHRNLAPLKGWCYERGRLLLVYEFMANGSLDNWIFAERGEALDWGTRYKIIGGVAAALLYLHEEWEQPVVHRDVKASNVLLDSNFNARLGDFGLARITQNNIAETTIVAGTPGYLAPEYILTGRATKEADVFSFGTVALEVACGRRPMDHSLPSDAAMLVDWVWSLHGRGRLLAAADPKLHGAFDTEGMHNLLLLGLACSHPNPLARPTMRHVIEIILSDAALPEVPPSKPKAQYGPLPPMSIDEILSPDIETALVSSATDRALDLTKPLLPGEVSH